MHLEGVSIVFLQTSYAEWNLKGCCTVLERHVRRSTIRLKTKRLVCTFTRLSSTTCVDKEQ
jgi:hypothetical protein